MTAHGRLESIHANAQIIHTHGTVHSAPRAVTIWRGPWRSCHLGHRAPVVGSPGYAHTASVALVAQPQQPLFSGTKSSDRPPPKRRPSELEAQHTNGTKWFAGQFNLMYDCWVTIARAET